MKKITLLFSTIVLILLFSQIANSQTSAEDCACCTEEHKQFDFWLGDWEVYDVDGKFLGTNNVLSLQDHCIIQENWKSESMSGTSYNYYNSQTLEWNQLWIDNKGGNLELSGAMQGKKMVLKSRVRYYPDTEEEVFDEISWQYNMDGTVTQTWVLRSVGGKIVKKLFTGIYKTKKE